MGETVRMFALPSCSAALSIVRWDRRLAIDLSLFQQQGSLTGALCPSCAVLFGAVCGFAEATSSSGVLSQPALMCALLQGAARCLAKSNASNRACSWQRLGSGRCPTLGDA